MIVEDHTPPLTPEQAAEEAIAILEAVLEEHRGMKHTAMGLTRLIFGLHYAQTHAIGALETLLLLESGDS